MPWGTRSGGIVGFECLYPGEDQVLQRNYPHRFGSSCTVSYERDRRSTPAFPDDELAGRGARRVERCSNLVRPFASAKYTAHAQESLDDATDATACEPSGKYAWFTGTHGRRDRPEFLLTLSALE